MPAVDVDALTIRYGDVVAVDGLSFSAERGQVTVVLGANGAGKSSTIEAIEGYRRPASGTIGVLGLDPQRDRAALTPRIGVMPQGGGLHPAMRPLETLRLYATFYDDPDDATALLERVGLAERRSTAIRHLSGGEQQRLSLALALIGRPEVVLLDEPTAGVDVDGRHLIRDLIGELRGRGACVLLTTHDLAEGERVADRVVVIDRGRLVADGGIDDLLAGDELRFHAPAGLDVEALSRRLGVAFVETSPGVYRAPGPATPSVLAALGAWLDERGVASVELRSGRATLEDVFLRLTNEGER